VNRQFVRTLYQIANLMTGFRIELAAGSVLAYVAARAFAALCVSARRAQTSRGVAAVSDNEPTYESDLKKTVTAVLDKFPAAHADLSIRPELRERSPRGQ
jgi:hypothetical protein